MEQRLAQSLDMLCDAATHKRFVPITEYDVTAFLYWGLVTAADGSAAEVHVSAPVPKTHDKRYKPDIVIGPVTAVKEYIEDLSERLKDADASVLSKLGVGSHAELLGDIQSRAFQENLRPSVRKQRVCVEIKAFLPEVRPQYWHNALKTLNKKDIPALTSSAAEEKVLILFDSVPFLNDRRVRTLRDSASAELQMILVQKNPVDSFAWRVLQLVNPQSES